jgi:hypothetical protein
VHDLKLGRLAIASLPPNIQSVLCAARILVEPRTSESQQHAWSEAIQRWRVKFRENGYAPISGLIHPYLLAALRQHYRRKIRTGTMHLGDGQSSRRYVAHNEPAARFFHLQLTPLVSRLVGEPVKPSYTYAAAYLSGARLEKHTDREQCAFSITLCIDYSPEPAGATSWPLHLQTSNGTTTVYQALGDGLLYRGQELPHYRGTLTKGHTSTSIFFHYVRENFAGSLD